VGGGGGEGWDDAVFVCLLFVSLPRARATTALCCSNPSASLVFLVRFRSWAAQVSFAGALPVCSLQNLAFLDFFLRYYCSVLVLFAPAVCFLVFFCFLYILFRGLCCCYLSHMPLNNGYKICFYLFGLLLSLLVRVFFSPSSLFLQLLFGSVFCILWERFVSNCRCDGLVSAVGFGKFCFLDWFFCGFWCFSLWAWTPDLFLFLKRALSNRLLKHLLDPCCPVLRAVVILLRLWLNEGF